MRSGLLRPRDEDPLLHKTAYLKPARIRFDRDTLERIKAVQQHILDIFPVNFPYGEDGTLFFSNKDAMPYDWDWQSLYSLAAELHKRIDEDRNWDEDTEDELETTCNEIFFQQAVRCSGLEDSANVTSHTTLVHH
ncbi:hypothetical protein CKM354_000010700 [Cercospora kikuchii]|uniref:Uncharacterized protein n=1 Tax=Cercospora kikuchii TaxID=84275 RepID=A0A9P3C8B7_9PEZI|nr:uncharacterized protein CKM354_000010700 [Cercospora kikuchii]GIZ36637.1 hypothetical protein CKM354_000010700 [Cercospora kikuchii]